MVDERSNDIEVKPEGGENNHKRVYIIRREVCQGRLATCSRSSPR